MIEDLALRDTNNIFLTIILTEDNSAVIINKKANKKRFIFPTPMIYILHENID